MKSRWFKTGLLFALFASLIFISACKGTNTNSGVKENHSPSAEAGSNQTNPSQKTEEELPFTAPLSGKPLAQPITRRPIAVMINNAPAARPQSGLNGADMVYEVLAEGGVTRLVAIYQSGGEVARIGPIRSIRPYMINLGESYHGVLVHAGASNDAFAILQRQHKEDLDEITNAGPYFWRDKSRKAPHNLYSNMEKLLEGAAKRKYATEDKAVPAYSFRDENDPATGDIADRVEIKFLQDNYRVSYTYDPKTRLYNRYISGEAHTDLDTGEQLTAANVIVMGADHRTIDDVGHVGVDLDLGGEALLFQRGKVMRVNWIHKSGDIIRFVKDNREVPFYPGRTHILVVPNTPDFDSHVFIQ